MAEHDCTRPRAFDPSALEQLRQHPEWVVTEDIVQIDSMAGPIWLPRRVMSALYSADEQLGRASSNFAKLLGSFVGDLGLYVMAGQRSFRASLDIAQIVEQLRQDEREQGYTSFEVARRLGRLENDCFKGWSHTNGREVDVALVDRANGFLTGDGLCYGAYYYAASWPKSFPGRIALQPAQAGLAKTLLDIAMQNNGFVGNLGRPWHFFYRGD